MRKLSNKQRIKAYEFVLERLSKENKNTSGELFDIGTEPLSYGGLCYYLDNWLSHLRIWTISWEEVLKYFPEFKQCKPFDSGGFWWPRDDAGFTIRVAVMQWCIEQIKKQKYI